MAKVEGLLDEIPLFDNVPFKKINVTALKGLSNKNFLLQYNDTKNKKMQSVLRIPQSKTSTIVNRCNEKHNRNLAYKLGLAPKTLWQNKQGVSLTEYINDARKLTSKDLEKDQIVADIAELMKTLHQSNVIFKGSLFPEDIAKCFDHYFSLCSEKNKLELKPEHQEILALCEKVKANKRTSVPSHIDLSDNILIQKNKMWIIDWEYSAMASPFWDLATVCNAMSLNQEQIKQLLSLCILESSETDYKCLKDYQQLELKLANYWLRAFSRAEG